MNYSDELLSRIAQQYHINKGNIESDHDWKIRIVYSICGMMAYASLWDESEEDAISIKHLKRRVRSMLSNYKLMYPELAGHLPSVSEVFEDEIANLFLDTGVVYHRPHRIAPSVCQEKTVDPICFQRGIAIDRISCVSGIGFYSLQSGPSNPEDIQRMFGLEREKLVTLWESTVSNAVWETHTLIEQNTEYLRLESPFSRGYWVSRPDLSGRVSILRTGMKGLQLYYLYRYAGHRFEISPLPRWQVEEHHYRTLANACLASYGELPAIQYTSDGDLIHLRINYLLPPRELEFLKLYSWPDVCVSLPCNFKRKLSKEVFDAIKIILSDEGYEFQEEGPNA